MKKLYAPLFLLLISASLLLHSCGTPTSLKVADELYKKESFAEAAEMYKKLYPKEKDKEKKKYICKQTADCYRLTNEYKKAEVWYKKAITTLKINDPELLQHYADVIMSQERYEDAIVEFKNYQKNNPTDTLAQKYINCCEQSLKWKKEKSRYVLDNAKQLNSKDNDFGITYYKKDELYFTSDREGGKDDKIYGRSGNTYSDIYSTKIGKKAAAGSYSKPTILEGEIITDYNDGTPTFDKKGHMFYTQCNGVKGKENVCKIWSAELQGKVWGGLEVLPFNDSTYNCGQPSVTEDGQTLYFSSDMPGGQGGLDIWFVTYVKKSKTWSEPVNVGPTINTPGNETFPFIHKDGTLYFASDGHCGMGGLDIYMTKGQGNEWTPPKNMKYPINSGADDFNFICDDTKEKGFISSNRSGGKGGDDIYSFYMNPLEITLTGVVRDCDTKEIIPGANVTLTNNIDSTKLVVKTDPTGTYKFTKLKANAMYKVSAEKQVDYYFDSKPETRSTYGIEVSTTLVADMCLKQIPISFDLYILYDLDKAAIWTREDSKLILDSLVTLLNTYPKVTIELGSHTDCRADSAYNMDLSQRRADSAVAYLVYKGIDPDRMVAKGYGENDLKIKKCQCDRSDILKICTEEEHQQNRRTTVRITGKNYTPKKKDNKPNNNKQPNNQQNKTNQPNNNTTNPPKDKTTTPNNTTNPPKDKTTTPNKDQKTNFQGGGFNAPTDTTQKIQLTPKDKKKP